MAIRKYAFGLIPYKARLETPNFKAISSSVSSLNKRYLLNDLNKYLHSDLSVNTPYYGKVCALYGLRRTGKTTMMLQSILGMTNEQFDKTAWIDVTEEDNMASLYLDLQKLNEQGHKYTHHLLHGDISSATWGHFVCCMGTFRLLHGDIKFILSR